MNKRQSIINKWEQYHDKLTIAYYQNGDFTKDHFEDLHSGYQEAQEQELHEAGLAPYNEKLAEWLGLSHIE